MTTKTIVATLAGVTSLWLMLESERWFNLQFITACVSMLIAAYWAVQTFRTLLDSLRVKDNDETDDEIAELSAKLRSPLPIDVENATSWTSRPTGSSKQAPIAEATHPESESDENSSDEPKGDESNELNDGEPELQPSTLDS
jgi:hypothetical protein